MTNLSPSAVGDFGGAGEYKCAQAKFSRVYYNMV